jgi:hypothetical protein
MPSPRPEVTGFLADAVLTRSEIDRFLDTEQPSWARFDPQLGYVPNASRVPDGIDGSISTYTYGSLGERLVVNHAGTACRVHTYGDSMTQCHQVSDGETWQEYLAAHLGEPILNFGVGGYGVHQAIARLRRNRDEAPFVVLNIFHDDHFRSLDKWRLLRVGKVWRDYDASLTTSMFHANPWEHVRFDGGGGLVTLPNLCPTQESLYNLCDLDFLVEHFADDLVTDVLVGRTTGHLPPDEAYAPLAEALGVPVHEDAGGEAQPLVERVYAAAAIEASLRMVADLRTHLEARGSRLLVALSYPSSIVAQHLAGERRPDEAFLSGLADLGLPTFDILDHHAADYAAFSCSPEEYVDRLFIGHYTPAGNHFFAMALRKTLTEWLDPAPSAYFEPEKSFAVQAARLA